MIARRAAFLADYQDAAWAARYRAIVDRVRRAEAPSGSETLTDAVARSLFKLMSYKDEHEVARLHVATGFREGLMREFTGDFKLRYHLAPPLLPAGRDARGRPRKIALGSWMHGPLALLARLKRLRGTPFDPFGYAAERRAERGLISWYDELVALALRELPRTGVARLVPIAAAAMEIRGYGPVKGKAIAEVKARVAQLVDALKEEPRAAA